MPPEPARQGKPLVVAFVTIFLDLLGFGLVIPVQAFYVESLGATAKVVTALGASYSLMQFLFAPFWGRLSDRVGRRPIVLSSVAIGALGHLLFGLSGSLAMIFAARMLAGFGNANIGTAQAIVSDVTTPETRAKGMGMIGAAFGLGFIFGPALGGLLSQISPTAPFFAAAGLGVANLALAYLYLPETRRPGATVDGHARREILSLAALRQATRHVNVASVLPLTLVVTIGFAMMEQTIGLFIEHSWLAHDGNALGSPERIKEAARLTAYFLVAVGITITVIQGGLIGRLQRRFGEVALVRAGVVVLTASLGLVPAMVGARSMPLMLLSAVLLAVGSGLLTPSSQSLLSRSIGDDEQGGILGLNQSLSALGRALGPAVAGWLFDWQNGLPFYAGAGLLALAFAFTVRLALPKPAGAAAGGSVGSRASAPA